MAPFFPFEPAPADYPNQLISPTPVRCDLRPAYGVLPALVVLCLIPRVMMTLRIPSICPDGVLYINLAKALDAGDLQAGFRDMALNTYPVILVGLHRLGFDWEFGAMLWGVVASCLVILPLWGWVRRQFDDRVALVACLLYIINPKLIEWSPEVMRDQTFWLLLVLAVYWLWRAVTEIRYPYFVGAGAAFWLASLTRIEGLFLLIPIVLWTFWRFLALQQERRKLLLGTALCLGLFPLFIVLLNVLWLCGHSGWTTMRFTTLARVQPWLESIFGGVSPITEGDEKPLSFGRMIWVFIPTMTRGLSPIFALLMFGGIWGWRRVWARRDNQPLFLVACIIMCGIWVQLWYDKNICPRYALPIVLMASPLAALGFLGLLHRFSRIGNWLGCGHRIQAVSTIVLMGAIGVVSLGDAMTSSGKYFATRKMAVDVGDWTRRTFSTPPMFVGPVGLTPIISFYAADAPYQMFRWEASNEAILEMVGAAKPGIVLLRPIKQLSMERCNELIEQLRRQGLEPLDSRFLPPSCGDLFVLLRPTAKLQAEQKPTRVY